MSDKTQLSTFTLIPSMTVIKVFIDIEKAKEFMIEQGAVNLPSAAARAAGAVTFGALVKSKKIVVLWFNTEPRYSGMILQRNIAHESVHALARVLEVLGIDPNLPEEIRAQMTGQVYREIAEQLVELGIDLSRPAEPRPE
jgi:hypothetical protein